MRILAHRGSPLPGSLENTVPAVSAALDAGADGVEVDLRLTADGVLAVCHDRALTRLAGSPRSVTRSTWERLREVAPLARVEWVLAAAAGRHVVLELKPAPRAVAEVLIERLRVLDAAGLPLDVTVSSFDPLLVGAFRDLVPGDLRVRTALLGDRGRLPLAILRLALAAGHDQVHPHVDDLLDHPGVVATAARCGVGVVPWTVNRRSDLRQCARLGVEAVITDVPQTARSVARARRTAA